MTRQEILDRTIQIIRDCIPELEGVELREDTVVNTDMGMDSMNFILVICKLEAEFDARIPDRQWKKLATLGDVVGAVEKYRK